MSEWVELFRAQLETGSSSGLEQGLWVNGFEFAAHIFGEL